MRNLKNSTLTGFLTALLGLAAAGTSLAAPIFTDINLGTSVAPPGTGVFNPTTHTITVTGGGSIISGPDTGNFYYTPVTGNFTATARITGKLAGDGNALVGIMVRNALTQNAADAESDILPAANATFPLSRESDFAGVSFVGSELTLPTLPTWVRLVVAGTSVTEEVSTNGTAWTTVGSETVTLGSTNYVGLAVGDQLDTHDASFTFDDFTITSASLNYNSSSDPGPIVPEPGLLGLLGVGLFAALWLPRRGSRNLAA